MRAFEILNEMIIRSGEPSDGSLIAFGPYIWIFNNHHIQEEKLEKKILKDISQKTGVKVSDFETLEQVIRDERPDILFATIYKNHLYLSSDDLRHFPKSSPLIQKVVKQLGLSGVIRTTMDTEGNDREEDFSKNEIVGNIPEVVYHGTCTKFIDSILRTGIRPTENSNWGKLKFKDKIYLTADINNAMFHANNQAKRYACAPVIVATKIPNRNLITLDYDVAATFYGADPEKTKNTGYLQHIKNQNMEWRKESIKKIKKYNPKTDFTKATGIFAYKGSIRSTSFVKIISTLNDEVMFSHENHGYVFDNKQEFLKAFEMYQEFSFYDPDYNPDEDSED